MWRACNYLVFWIHISEDYVFKLLVSSWSCDLQLRKKQPRMCNTLSSLVNRRFLTESYLSVPLEESNLQPSNTELKGARSHLLT